MGWGNTEESVNTIGNSNSADLLEMYVDKKYIRLRMDNKICDT